MTITTCVPVAGRELRTGEDGVATMSLRYDFFTSTVLDPIEAYADFIAYMSLLGVGDTYGTLRVVGIQVRDNPASPKYYTAEISYSNEFELDPNPLLEPARISVGCEFYQVPVFQDRYGKPLLTKSGEYPEGLYEDAVQINFTVTKNVASVPAWLLLAAGATNISPFSIRGVGIDSDKARLSSVSLSDEMTRNGFLFYRLVLAISYRNEGWKTRFLNRGFYEKLTPSASPTPVYDEHGNKTATPWPLDVNGKKITTPSITNVLMLEFDTKLAFDFSSLPLA